MAQTRRSKTVTLPNGNRVTVTTGYNRGGYYKTVSVRRNDGTGESQTYRRNIGLFGTGLFDVAGPYGDDIPAWASAPGSITHGRSIQGANSRPVELSRGRLFLVLLVAATVITAGTWAWDRTHINPYQDGRSWALINETSFSFPEPWIGCNRADMVNSGPVQVGGDRTVDGDGKPHDSYAKWLAGCGSTKAFYEAQFNAPNG
jgi:hypothetical protein